MEINKNSYVTIFNPIGGWNSVLMVFDEDMGTHVPFQTGINNTLGSGKKEDAIKEAKQWAFCEDIEYRRYDNSI